MLHINSKYLFLCFFTFLFYSFIFLCGHQISLVLTKKYETWKARIALLSEAKYNIVPVFLHLVCNRSDIAKHRISNNWILLK